MIDKVFCSECLKQGIKSRVWVVSTVVTAMPSNIFYDEDGNYHIHDPNEYQTSYHCGNGHQWTDKYKHKCWCEGD